LSRGSRFYWGEGYILCSITSGNLEVRASNTTIVFENRSLYIEGLFEKIREHRWRQGKNIYIDLAFPIKGIKGGGAIHKADIDTYIGSYGLAYTIIEGIGYYLTIYPPPGSLYEYATISKDMVMLRTSLRREVYLIAENSGKRIILV
jgi:hypothetical protein